MESSSIKDGQRKIESETTERKNVIKLEPEMKTASEKISRNGESYTVNLVHPL